MMAHVHPQLHELFVRTPRYVVGIVVDPPPAYAHLESRLAHTLDGLQKVVR